MFENADYAADNRFVTAAQAKDMGSLIRKGEHAAARVIRMVEVDRRKVSMETDGDVVAEEDGKYLVLKTYAVFHVSQLEPALPPLVKVQASETPVAAVGAIVDALKATGLKIAEGPFEPVYIPKLDLIRIPPISSFHGVDADDASANWHGILLHEMSHSVGAPKRLGSFGMSQMSLQERAMEELVAEWSAAMLCSDIKGIKLGEDHIQQHSAYLASWMQVLNDDKNAIFRAAAAAQRTCDYLTRLCVPRQTTAPITNKSPAANKPVTVIEPVPRKLALR